MLTFKRKLKLTKAQQSRIDSWVGSCRVVYNLSLEIRMEAWKNKQQKINKYELQKQITELRNDVEWIKDAPISSLQNVTERLDSAYDKFFKGGGFPKWASKKSYKSILIKQCGNQIRIQGDRIKLPKIGALKMYNDTKVIGSIKRVTIIKDPTGYFACIMTDTIKDIQQKDENQVVGLDMGINHFCVDSAGVFISNPKHFKSYESKLRIESRSLCRKKKGSNAWIRQVKKVALLHHKIANIRKDFLHKESTKIAKKFHTVILEDLNIKGMSRNRKLSKHILDAGWSAFRTMLEYKTNVIAVDPKFTSQTCNDCGVKDAKSRISQSQFVCTACGVESNADENAAKNILGKGIPFIRQRDAIACA